MKYNLCSFPEIPLFHVLNARVTFGNIYGLDSSVPHVLCLQDGDNQSCVLDDLVFEIPAEYRNQGKNHIFILLL
jgi:ankyrin repeat domain-containing protein 13